MPFINERISEETLMSTFNIRIDKRSYEILMQHTCGYPLYGNKSDGKWYWRSAVNGRIGLRLCPKCEKPIDAGAGKEAK